MAAPAFSPAVPDKPALLSSSVAVRLEPLSLWVCILSGIEPEQLVEGPGASLSSEVEA